MFWGEGEGGSKFKNMAQASREFLRSVADVVCNLIGRYLLSITKWSNLIGRYMMLSINSSEEIEVVHLHECEVLSINK